MSTRIIQVDSFTNRPFRRQPRGRLPARRTRAGLVDAARRGRDEPVGDRIRPSPIEPGSLFRLRWFTPTVEVDLCGHATLAAAHVLWEEGCLLGQAPALFETRSGRLACPPTGRLDRDGFPCRSDRHAVTDLGELDRIAAALDAPFVSAGRTGSTSWSSSPTSRPCGASQPDIPLDRRSSPFAE